MLQGIRVAFVVVILGVAGAGTPHAAAQGTPLPSAPPPSALPAGTSAIPTVQKSYIFEGIFVPLLIVLALTAICRSSGRS